MEDNIMIDENNIDEILEEQICTSYVDFFKINVLETLKQKMDEERFIISMDKVDEIAENLLNDDEIFDVINSHILEEFQKIRNNCEEE